MWKVPESFWAGIWQGRSDLPEKGFVICAELGNPYESLSTNWWETKIMAAGVDTIPILGVHAQLLSCVQLFVTPWTVARQAPLSTRILQARILEWVAISFSRASSQPRDRSQVFCIGRKILYHWATWEACCFKKVCGNLLHGNMKLIQAYNAVIHFFTLTISVRCINVFLINEIHGYRNFVLITSFNLLGSHSSSVKLSF